MTLKCFLFECQVQRDPEQGSEWGSYCSAQCREQGERQAVGGFQALARSPDAQTADSAGPNSHGRSLCQQGLYEPKEHQVDA